MAEPTGLSNEEAAALCKPIDTETKVIAAWLKLVAVIILRSTVPQQQLFLMSGARIFLPRTFCSNKPCTV